MSKNQIEGGVIIFKFQGGPRDEDSIRSDVKTDSDSTNEATMLWATTKGGKIGHPARVTAGGTIADLIGQDVGVGENQKSASKKHQYRVAERVDGEKEITVLLEFEKTID